MQPIPMNMSRCSCLFAVVDSTFGLTEPLLLLLRHCWHHRLLPQS